MKVDLQPVVIGMDPHKRSVTIEVMTVGETVVGGGRFATDAAGYRAMLGNVGEWPNRVWAIEGCSGIGRRIAMRLLADDQEVVDVPPKLSARARVFATGQGRKTDATDAHSVALVGTRMNGLRPVVNNEQLEVLRLLVDRRRCIGEEHTRKVSQLHALLLELIPGGAKRDLSAAQARKLLASVRPRDSWSRSVRSPASPTATTSHPGPAPRRSMRPPVTTSANGSPAAATGRSTGCYTSWPPSSCATPPMAAPNSDSSATGSHPHTGSSDKPLHGPASIQPRPVLPKVS